MFTLFSVVTLVAFVSGGLLLMFAVGDYFILHKKPQFIRMGTILLAVSALMLWSYSVGQSKTIKEAELISITEEGYSLSFDGEIHYYTFDK